MESNGKTDKRFSLSDVVLDAIQPGVNHSVLMFVNIVFLLLILTVILIMGFSSGYKMYMMILLLILAVGLFIGFNKYEPFKGYSVLTLII